MGRVVRFGPILRWLGPSDSQIRFYSVGFRNIGLHKKTDHCFRSKSKILRLRIGSHKNQPCAILYFENPMGRVVRFWPKIIGSVCASTGTDLLEHFVRLHPMPCVPAWWLIVKLQTQYPYEHIKYDNTWNVSFIYSSYCYLRMIHIHVRASLRKSGHTE